MNHSPLEEHLLDHDGGSCRDVNFCGAKWEGVWPLVTLLTKSSRSFDVSGFDGGDEMEFSQTDLESLISRNKSAHISFYHPDKALTDLQLYLAKEEDGTPHIELTFFPDAVVKSPTLGKDFITFLSKLSANLGSTRVFCRYENLGWKFGDIGPHSGVFWDSSGENQLTESESLS